MRRLFLLLCLCLPLLAQDDPIPDVAWFDHVSKPSSLTQEQLCQFTAKLFNALKEKWPAKKLEEILPDDPSPRVVFLTLGEENWPGRCYYGTGFTFKQALQDALTILNTNEPLMAERIAKQADITIKDLQKENQPVPAAWRERAKNPSKWNWLRMDVVQCSRPVGGFSVPRSRIAMTSLTGLAFGPDIGFAFTPDQITGRCLLDSTRHLAKQQIVNFISETYNLPALASWMQISEIATGYRVCLFETDSYYSNGSFTTRIYRGHTLPQTAITKENALEMATKCAQNIMGCISPKNGKLTPPFSNWIAEEIPSEYAELSLALCRLAKLTGNDQLRNDARQAIFSLTRREKPVSVALRIIEKERLPKDTIQLPRNTAQIRTNSLAALAYLELGTEEDIKKARQLATYIRTLYNGDLRFLNGMFTDQTEQPQTDWNDEIAFASPEDTAIAALALFRVAKTEPQIQEWQELAGKILLHLLKTRVEASSMEELDKNSPWLLEALLELPRTDGRFTEQLLRLAFAAISDIEYNPLYPDYYGAIEKVASCTNAARRTRLLCQLSKWLYAVEKPAWARKEMQEVLPILLFQSQAFIDEAGSSSLPSPALYRGWFRDNLEDYGFDLASQVAQLFSLTAYAEMLQTHGLPNTEKFDKELAEIRSNTDTHPGILQINPVITDQENTSDDQRNVIGTWKEGEATQGTANDFLAPTPKPKN